MSPVEFLSHLKKQAQDGVLPECYLFWGGFLSQWCASPFTVDGVRFPTAEHYMMAEKAKQFNNNAAYNEILSTPYPKSAKEIGRSLPSYDDSVWSSVRYQVVIAGNIAKFTQNESLKKNLLDTGDKILVEASPYDAIWGISLSEDNPAAANPLQWKGLNLLGFALMEVRKTLGRASRPTMIE